jgi:hypothetical protein
VLLGHLRGHYIVGYVFWYVLLGKNSQIRAARPRQRTLRAARAKTHSPRRLRTGRATRLRPRLSMEFFASTIAGLAEAVGLASRVAVTSTIGRLDGLPGQRERVRRLLSTSGRLAIYRVAG